MVKKKLTTSFKAGMFALGEGINAFNRGLSGKKNFVSNISSKVKKGIKAKATHQYTNTWGTRNVR